ncbi:MAG: GNAT family N-acetyltransferase [Pseudomonadota bacterium]
MTTLETERLILRRPVMEDGPAAVTYLNDFEMARNLSRIPHPYGIEDWQWFMRELVEETTEDIFALTDRKTATFMGIISLQTDRHEPILGYWLGQPFRRRCYMGEAAVAFIRYGFKAYDTPSFISGHFKDNPISGRILTFLGFETFAEEDETSLARGDEVIRHVTMRLTREKFEALHPLG